MRTALYTAAALAGAVMLHTAPADAGVRNFFSPQLEDALLAFCLETSGECGKPVADAWCQVNGFDEAVLFQRQEVPATCWPRCTPTRARSVPPTPAPASTRSSATAATADPLSSPDRATQ
jgi:hypothetical protein